MLTFILAYVFLAAAPNVVTGVVRDSSGAAVPAAVVIVRAPSGSPQQTLTGSDGRFTIEVAPGGDLVVTVRAGGFAEQTRSVSEAERERDLDFVVMPAELLETVTVTSTRSEQRLGDIPASVSVVTNEDIRSSPAVVADDVLRQVPTFSLFRRTSSLVAQPTTQGVSLRGIGPSGQSRTLVLLDGVPFNDPFGGWVYWTRVPLESVDRVEVTEGTASSLYGNYAMGGVVNIITNRPTRQTIEFKTQYGTETSPKAEFFASDAWRKVGVVVEGSYFNTDGFYIVAPRERGPIDNKANVRFGNIGTRVELTPTDHVQGSVRVSYFNEDRGNGKVGEVNDTNWTSVNGGVRIQMPDGSNLQANGFGDIERSHFNFLAVTNSATTRNVVRLATDQHVPTNAAGGMAQWSKAIGMSNVFSAGMDGRWVDGDSQEDAYVATVPTSIVGVTQAATLSVQRVSGGTQRSLGAFMQDIYTPAPKVVLTLSARLDHWHNYDGHNLETTVATGLPTANNNPALPDRDDTVLSPRAAALYHVSDRVTAWGAWTSGFRAPTLTELYRQFSVGAVTTFPNSQLAPERLVGGEAGLNFAPARNLTVRTTWFDDRVRNEVFNITITPTRAQKQNVEKTRIWGLQTDAEYRAGQSWRFGAAYVYEQAKVVESLANPGLVNNCQGVAGEACFLQQVPRHRASFQAAYANPRYVTLAAGVQFVGLQYNDDLNVNAIPAATLTEAGYATSTIYGLPGYAVLDLTASRDFGPHLQAFVGAQNLLNQVYFVQTNPSTTGTPRLVNGGVRIRFAGR